MQVQNRTIHSFKDVKKVKERPPWGTAGADWYPEKQLGKGQTSKSHSLFSIPFSSFLTTKFVAGGGLKDRMGYKEEESGCCGWCWYGEIAEGTRWTDEIHLRLTERKDECFLFLFVCVLNCGKNEEKERGKKAKEFFKIFLSTIFKEQYISSNKNELPKMIEGNYNNI